MRCERLLMKREMNIIRHETNLKKNASLYSHKSERITKL